ncbi:MAG: hypothetical protein AC479_05225 [miscellaneous Crenarchaeota group-6 archaeon AD8-1]|nr:MAG: hypothetical protein AC479_05225 [miscellaneous Crenarchaeota group-6 archaeon AD8-1]
MNLESSKNIGGVGALLLLITPLASFFLSIFGSIIGLIGFILVLIAVKGLADYYNEGSIFSNTLYGIILTIIGAVIVTATFAIAAVGLLTDLGLDLATLVSDPNAINNLDFSAINLDLLWVHGATVLIGLVILFAFIVIAAIFYRKSLTSLSQKTGVGLFGTAGLLMLIGAILTIILIGYAVLWIALLILTIAFFSIRIEQTQPPTTTPTATPTTT